MENQTEKTKAGPLCSGDLFGLAARYWNAPFVYESGVVWSSGPNAARIIDVRGWGHLTGQGSHALEPHVAAKIQDQIGESIAELLTSHWPNTGYEPRDCGEKLKP